MTSGRCPYFANEERDTCRATRRSMPYSSSSLHLPPSASPSNSSGSWGASSSVSDLECRNVLIDQTMVNDFRPFGGVMAKLSARSNTIEKFEDAYNYMKYDGDLFHALQFRSHSPDPKNHPCNGGRRHREALGNGRFGEGVRGLGNVAPYLCVTAEGV
jgi:hypothetical protein